jgi:hypothetical protein|uniref:STAS domain-containing protein n=1 Tax=Oscillatoriales cyanobacterium SpSt-402 TaxID=2282168 RepID=A0A832H6X9_9CYAN
MEIKAEDYCIQYDVHGSTVNFYGSLLLNGAEEYAPIVQLLNNAIEQRTAFVTLNIQKLRMLNSSGFQMLSKFVMKVRQQGDIKLIIKGNPKISWQARSLQNLQRLMPAIQIELE